MRKMSGYSITFPSWRKPRSRRQDFSAHMPILQSIESMLWRVTQPFARELRLVTLRRDKSQNPNAVRADGPFS